MTHDYIDYKSWVKFMKLRKYRRKRISTPLTDEEYDYLTKEEQKCFQRVNYGQVFELQSKTDGKRTNDKDPSRKSSKILPIL